MVVRSKVMASRKGRQDIISALISKPNYDDNDYKQINQAIGELDQWMEEYD